MRKNSRRDKFCFWIAEEINKKFNYNQIKYGKSFHFVEEHVNRSATYLATLEINEWNSLHLVRESFGRLQEKLNLNMNFDPSHPQLHVTPIPRDVRGFVRGFAPHNVSTPTVMAVKISNSFENGNNAIMVI